MADWQPIETAPKDGTPVIVTDGLGVYDGAWWHPGEEAWLGCDGCCPTRWMSLPPPSGWPLPTEVARLVLAAREVAFADEITPDAIRKLDQASEAFAERVPWEDEPTPTQGEA